MTTFLLTFGKGKLTYFLAAVTLLWGVFGYLMGLIDGDVAMSAIWSSLALFGIRRAVQK